MSAEEVDKGCHRHQPNLSPKKKLAVLLYLTSRVVNGVLARGAKVAASREFGCHHHTISTIWSLCTLEASLELPSSKQGMSMAQVRAEYSNSRSVIRKGCAVLVKNRRYRRLLQLLEDTSSEDHYFSDSMMQQRNPALFHFYLGQYVGQDKSTAPSAGSEGQTLSSFLMDTCQRSEMETRRVAEQETWGRFTAADEKHELSRLERLYEEENTEEKEEEVEEEEDSTLYTIQERREQLIEVMSSRFLNGEDSEYVNYAEIDGDEALDDFDEMQRDAEDRYFAEDEVSLVN